MSVAQLKSKPEQGVFYRLRFNELPTINRSTLGHYWSSARADGAVAICVGIRYGAISNDMKL
jgi:hypothetical protein